MMMEGGGNENLCTEKFLCFDGWCVLLLIDWLYLTRLNYPIVFSERKYTLIVYE